MCVRARVLEGAALALRSVVLYSVIQLHSYMYNCCLSAICYTSIFCYTPSSSVTKLQRYVTGVSWVCYSYTSVTEAGNAVSYRHQPPPSTSLSVVFPVPFRFVAVGSHSVESPGQ